MNKSSSIITNRCVQCVVCVRKLDHGFLRCIESNCDLNSDHLEDSEDKTTSVCCNSCSSITNKNNNKNGSSVNNNNNTNSKPRGFCKSPSSETSTHMTHMTQACLLKQKLPLQSSLGSIGFVCFDFEWAPLPDANGEQKFRAASFVDNNGSKKVLLIEDYAKQFGGKAECALLIEVVNYLSKYDYSFGWYSSGVEVYDELKHRTKGKNSDLVMLDKRLKANGIQSVIGYTQSGIPYLVVSKHIDALQIYDKPMVKTTIYKNKYKSSMSLDTVAKAITGRGKYKGYSGLDFDRLPTLEDKREYVLEDAHLVLDLLQHNNFEILCLMDSIATLTGLSFEMLRCEWQEQWRLRCEWHQPQQHWCAWRQPRRLRCAWRQRQQRWSVWREHL